MHWIDPFNNTKSSLKVSKDGDFEVLSILDPFAAF